MSNKEDILVNLKQELLRIGSSNRASYDQLKKTGNLSSSQISRNLGLSWREIVKDLGLKPERELSPPNEMLTALKGEFKRLQSFKKEDYKKHRNKEQFPYPGVLTKHLGMTWAEITQACGCLDTKESIKDNVSDEDLIKEYKEMSKEMGKPATIEELKKTTEYSYDIYRQHFGTIGQLREACGFKVKTKRAAPIITKDDCVRELRAIYNKNGRLTYNQLKDKSTISLSTIFRKFHTTKINEIWEEVLKTKKTEQGN
ncbi:hypothetical protein M4D76_16145 [Peribacillus frigoritolerans]|uniref:homing endonuclease associated repeat-containing protein n=1 Tax=Peribacillus frigoritolerans TaxID=450367 RepID=UPI0021A76898|nr:hypothetical protein [Peribacillus frigoritolerans]MCT1389827.1 hypothetical protein [Peribacillus frigoritolerans]